MQITCDHCQRQISLPDEKVPTGPFALTCPGCRERIQVDPTRTDATPAEATAAARVDFEPLPAVRELDKELLGALYPVAAVVRLTADGEATAGDADAFEAGLRLLGMEDVRHYDDMAAAAEAMLESDFSVMLIVMDKATAPPCEPLEPLYQVPAAVRRNTFVALTAGNVRSLDGQTAFYLQVNCLLSSREIAKFPGYLQHALVFHLRRYRFWGAQE